eukprot:scaffold80305_cov68-Cyclotella_meneghiniana.AAC.3
MKISPVHIVTILFATSEATTVKSGLKDNEKSHLRLSTKSFSQGDVAAGEQVFNANCAACHAGGRNNIMPDETLEKEALEKYLSGGRNEEAVVAQVTNGKNAMPSFGGRLSDDQIKDVAAYVIATADAGWDDEEFITYAEV